MQRVHRRYKYETVIITMGAVGVVPQSLEENLKKLNFAQGRIKTVTERMQKNSTHWDHEDMQNGDGNVKEL